MSNEKINVEIANPNPEFLIKSIAEQGYSLETALADLMDNSISANSNRIEILTDTESNPFELYLADNGDGMDFDSLKKNMQFPSQSPEDNRDLNDLGRFGLGLKTASFSQTRKFTVLSRRKGDSKFYGITWDVEHLRKTNRWEIIINSDDEVSTLYEKYLSLSDSHLSKSVEFIPNTIIIWKGLYKFENYLNELNRQDAFKGEITNNTSEYLSIVFHRFMERNSNPLQIRINNSMVIPFNPFRTDNSGLRVLEARQKEFGKDLVKIQGFVLPNSSIKESKSSNSIWTPVNKSLMDMEGIYVYRANRLILYGGWNGLIKKSPRMQLGRLRIEIGNKIDHLFHLNVAKSQINIPHDLKMSFLREISNLTTESQKEYFNHILVSVPNKQKKELNELFFKSASNKGVLLNYNFDFPILKSLTDSLNKQQRADLNFILKISSNTINKIRQVDNVEVQENSNIEGISLDEIIQSVNKLILLGMDKDQIKKNILPSIGFKNNLPEEISNLLN